MIEAIMKTKGKQITKKKYKTQSKEEQKGTMGTLFICD